MQVDAPTRPAPAFWTPEQDQALREMWVTGLTCTEIGKKIGKTKSAITGRAHRLELPARASPIKNPKPRDTQKEGAQRQAVLALYEVGVIDPSEIERRTGIARTRVMNIFSRAGIKIGRVRQHVARAKVEKDKPEGMSEPMKMPVYDVDPATLVTGVGGSRKHCQFIPGDPAGPRTLYCGRPVELGQTYCGQHHAICWRPHILQKRSSEAA